MADPIIPSNLTAFNYETGQPITPCCIVCTNHGYTGNIPSCPPDYLVNYRSVTVDGRTCACYDGCTPPVTCTAGGTLQGFAYTPGVDTICTSNCPPGEHRWYYNIGSSASCTMCSGDDMTSYGYASFAYAEGGHCYGNVPYMTDYCGCSCSPDAGMTPGYYPDGAPPCTTGQRRETVVCLNDNCTCLPDVTAHIDIYTPATIYCCNHQDDLTSPCYLACVGGYDGLLNDLCQIISDLPPPP